MRPPKRPPQPRDPTIKRCPGCKKTLPVDQFYKNRATNDGLATYCTACLGVKQRERRLSERQKLLALLGSVCKRCGFDDPRALQVDHVNGDGHLERKSGVFVTTVAFRKLVAENPKRYQILCANCNWIKRAEQEEGARGPKVRQPPTERTIGPGQGNSAGARAALARFTSDPEHQSRAAKSRRDTSSAGRAKLGKNNLNITKCPQGHSYKNPKNFAWRKNKNGTSVRVCLICSRKRTREWREGKKVEQ